MSALTLCWHANKRGTGGQSPEGEPFSGGLGGGMLRVCTLSIPPIGRGRQETQRERSPLCPLAPWGPPGIRALYRERGSNGSALKGGLEIPALTPTGFGQNGRLRRKIRGGSRGSTCVVMLLGRGGANERRGEERPSLCLKMAPSPEG